MHRRLTARHARDQIAHLQHCRRIAEQTGFRPVAPVAAGRQAQGGMDQRAQLLQRHRFGQIIKGARLERGHRIFQVAVRGDHRHRHIQIALRDMPHDLQPAAVAHPHIGQAQRESLFLQLPQRVRHPAGTHHLQPHAQQSQFQQFQDIRLVIHD